MSKLLCAVALLAITSSAMAETFTEDFSTYAGGSTTWNSGGVWNEPTKDLKLDAYTTDPPAPRTGNTAYRWAHAELENSVLSPGEYGVATIEFEALFYWDHAGCRNDGFFVVLSDDPAASLLVPAQDDLPLVNPINAIAWGHANTDAKNYSFFDGQTWTVCGFATQPGGGTDDWEVVSGAVQPDGSWSASSDGGGSGAGMLAVSDFTFDTVSIISYGDSSGYYSGIDNIKVSFVAIPEPTTLALLVLGLPLLLLLCRRRV